MVAKDFAAGDDVAVLFGDDHFIGSATKELVEVFDKYKTDIVGVKRCLTDDITSYGVMIGQEVEDGIMKCTGVKEKPPITDIPSRYYAVGRYICKGDIFDRLEKSKDKELSSNLNLFKNISIDEIIDIEMPYIKIRDLNPIVLDSRLK